MGRQKKKNLFKGGEKCLKKMISSKIKIRNELKAKIKNDIKEICKELIFELFNEKEDIRVVRGKEDWWNCNKTIFSLRKELKDCVVNSVADRCNDIYESKAKEFIAKEEFIDSIINRILKKQLKN